MGLVVRYMGNGESGKGKFRMKFKIENQDWKSKFKIKNEILKLNLKMRIKIEN